MQTIRYVVKDTVASITLDRPDQRNALNMEMAQDLLAAVKLVQADDEVRVVLIRGNGPTFCAGADLKERVGKSEQWVRNRRKAAYDAYEALATCQKPCIAVAHGPVVGSGCEIATACDFIIASDRATFRYPEAVWGSVGATQRLPRIVGRALAKELIFTGRTMDAQEALRVRLVNRVVATDNLDDTVNDVVAMILKAFPLSVQLVKRCIDQGMESDLRTGIELEKLAVERCLADENWKKGIEAFNAGHKSQGASA